nr:phenylcoumaran benzylic ether reductase POP1-like [Ziziphus jujuba var. spinosa]
MEKIDVVISAVSSVQIIDQRLLPSEFGMDVDRTPIVELAATALDRKVNIRRLIEAEAIFVGEEDIAAYTIKAVEDLRTLNKILYLSVPANILSINEIEIVSLWEKKIGNKFDKIYVLEDELLKQIQESSIPRSLILSIYHYAFVKGDDLNSSFGVKAYELYPEVKYTTIDQYLDRLV